MKNDVKPVRQNIFESIKHVDDNGEFWYARELGETLGYTNWKTFEKVVLAGKTLAKSLQLLTSKEERRRIPQSLELIKQTIKRFDKPSSNNKAFLPKITRH